MKDCWGYLTLNVTVKEASVWPEETYGSKDEPQTLGIMHFCLGAYARDYERLLTKQRLKTFDTVPQYLNALTDINTKLCAKAVKLREDDAVNQKRTPLKQARAELEAAKARAYSDKHPTPNPSDLPKGRVEFGSPDYPAMPKYGTDAEQSFASKAIPFGKTAPNPAGSGHDPEWSEDDENPKVTGLDALIGATPGGKTLFDPYARRLNATPVDPKKPCYSEFKTGCDGSCGGYSHDPALMEELSYTKLEDLVNSKHGGYERIKRNLDRILASRTASPSRPPAN